MIWSNFVPNKPIIVFDLEANSLDPDKIHCVSYARFWRGKEPEIKTITDMSEIKEFFENRDNVLAGHFIMNWDLPCAVKKLVGIDRRLDRCIDTLWLSHYLYPSVVEGKKKNQGHGLEAWGERLGISKPAIEDWEEGSIEDYTYRCEEDVRINYALLNEMFYKGTGLYGGIREFFRFIWYSQFKAYCISMHSELKWKIDTDKLSKNIGVLEMLYEQKRDLLEAVMPSVPIKDYKRPPKNPLKKDGSKAKHQLNWESFCIEHGYPADHNTEIQYVKKYDPPNAGSTPQIKKWLFSLGWEPISFDYKRDPDNYKVQRKVPQVRIEDKGEKVLCPSVKKLLAEEPGIEHLEGITVIKHRLNLLEGMEKNLKGGDHLVADAAGLTNTLRYRHRVLVNLPGVKKPYGEMVRECLIAPDGMELCGSDLSSLEDRTKQHFIWKYDPEFVKEMQVKGFDPHLDLAMIAGVLTQGQVDDHKRYSKTEGKEGRDHGVIRHQYKTGNYSCIYGVGAFKLSKTLGITEKEAAKIIKAYWNRNWSVKKLSKDIEVREIHIGDKIEMWLFNPLSKFWYSLRVKKDIFSTLNQGAGVFIMDSWVKLMMDKGLIPIGQFHDEVILVVDPEKKEEVRKKLKDSIKEVNNALPLNRLMDVDVKFGKSYAKIH